MKFSEIEREDMVKKIAYETVKLTVDEILKDDEETDGMKNFAARVLSICIHAEKIARDKIKEFENMSNKERKKYGTEESN